MSKTEIGVTKIVTDCFNFFVYEGYAGPNFDMNTFDIEKHVDVHLFLLYSNRKATSKQREVASILSRKIWNDLLIEYNSKLSSSF